MIILLQQVMKVVERVLANRIRRQAGVNEMHFFTCAMSSCYPIIIIIIIIIIIRKLVERRII